MCAFSLARSAAGELQTASETAPASKLSGVAATIKSSLSDAAAVKPVAEEFGAPIGVVADRVYAASNYAPIWRKEGAYSLLAATCSLFDYGIVVDTQGVACVEVLAVRTGKRRRRRANRVRGEVPTSER